MEWSQIVSAVLGGGFFAAAGALIKAVIGRKKASAEAAEIVTGSAMQAGDWIIGKLQQDVARLTASDRDKDERIARVEQRQRTWESYARGLYDSLKTWIATGHTPDPSMIPPLPEDVTN